MDPVNRIQPVQLPKQDAPSFSSKQTETGKGDLKEYPASKKKVEDLVAEANEYVVGLNAEFQFRTHDGTGRTVVQLLDMQTNEVIKEFPPHEMLDVLAKIWEQAGIMVDRTE